jgi:uncharacterized membrane protein YgdD (TMEM256/DUF423 family)
MWRFWTGWGAVHAFVAVAAGAFGAHGLKKILNPEMLAVFETAVRYQMFHALGLFAVAYAAGQGLNVQLAGWAMFTGIVLFSGSLYVLALSGITAFGAITPLGGVGFLVGWASLAWAAFRS